MPWVRLGDNSAHHPLLLNTLEHPDADDRLLNEAMGFFIRCASQAGAHLTDYVVTRGTAISIAGIARVDLLIDVCVAAGLMTEVVSGELLYYRLVDDDPDFLHLRLKKEIDWEKQRKEDAQRPSLTVPVRLRDGDGCRWCGRIVNWSDRKSGRAGTYDHLDAGEPATLDTYVVCCKSCNSSRRDGDLPAGVPALLPPPDEPLFSPYSVKWLTENRWRIDNGLPVPKATKPSDLNKIARKRPSSRLDHAPSTPPEHPAGRAPDDADPHHVPVAAEGAHRVSAADSTTGPVAPRTHGRPADSTTGPVAPTPQPAAADPAGVGAGPREQSHPAEAPPPTQGGGEPRQENPPDLHKPPINQVSGRYLADPADQHGTGSNPAGRGGAGRDGSGREPNSPNSSRNNSRRRRGTRGRGRSRKGQQ